MAVVAVTEASSETYADGASFGEAGTATMRRLRLEHAVDPAVARNRSIVDLELAERDGDGLVRFDHDVVIVQPADPAARNGWVLVDVANRGGPTASAFLQMDNTPFFPQPPQPPPGDGHLLGLGWTLAFTGWQFDIEGTSLLGLRAPVARRDGEELSGVVRSVLRASSASERLPLVSPGHRAWPPERGSALLFEDDEPQAPGSWGFSDDGLALVRTGGFTPGCWYRCEYRTSGALVGGCGLLALRDVAPWLRQHEQVTQALLFGVSQSGRLIRQFLHDGLNIDEAGRRAYDAFMPVIAGGRRGQFNRRFAVPATLPFGADELDEDATYGTLLDASGAPAKVMAVNSSNEYWRGDAAATAPDAHPDVRVHHVAGTQHSHGYLPQLFEIPALGWKGRNGFNIVDYRPVLRALLRQLTDWVDHGIEPTPSTAPDASQLSTREAVLQQFTAAGVATPRPASFVQPAGPVPAIDATGNEVGGIRLPDVAVPVGVHTGWNLRHPDIGAPEDELFLVGSTWWLHQLPPLDEHLGRSAEVLAELVAQRLLLPEDVAPLLARAELSWHAATS